MSYSAMAYSAMRLLRWLGRGPSGDSNAWPWGTYTVTRYDPIGIQLPRLYGGKRFHPWDGSAGKGAARLTDPLLKAAWQTRPRRRWADASSVVWDVTCIISWLAVLYLVVILALAGSPRGVREKLESAIGVKGLIPALSPESEASRTAEPARDSAISKKTRRGPGAGRRSPSEAGPLYFTVGSTKEEVRTVQGVPTESIENVWRYGLSEVYFEKGQVVGWRSSPGRPLKIRPQDAGA